MKKTGKIYGKDGKIKNKRSREGEETQQLGRNYSTSQKKNLPPH